VLVGTAAASLDGPTIWWRAGAALGVALAMQIGVNYANDYSDGVRGTDEVRRGPMRLTATGIASPVAVRRAAGLCFAVACGFGLALAIAVDLRLIVVGAAAVAAAVLYTGGPRPYGYSGFGELAVLAFFGFVATAGTAYVQARSVNASAWLGSLAVGLPACAILLANNIRDVDTDRAAGKRTLAVRFGARAARRLFVACLIGGMLAVALIGVAHPRALIAVAVAPLAIGPVRVVLTRSDPPSLVGALIATSRFELVLAALVAVGLFAS
jgi:1,4-dihydroxy-2-naphthoate octaprenyltransferase